MRKFSHSHGAGRNRPRAGRGRGRPAQSVSSSWHGRAHAFARTRIVLLLAVLQLVVMGGVTAFLVAFTFVTLPAALMIGLALSLLVNWTLMRYSLVELVQQTDS